MTDSDEDSDDSEEEETESFVNKKVKEGHFACSLILWCVPSLAPHSRLLIRLLHTELELGARVLHRQHHLLRQEGRLQLVHLQAG